MNYKILKCVLELCQDQPTKENSQNFQRALVELEVALEKIIKFFQEI